MITISQLTELLGWATIINMAYLFIATLALTVFRVQMISIHQKLTGLDDRELRVAYFKFLSSYKVMTLVFIVAPYIALKIMG